MNRADEAGELDVVERIVGAKTATYINAERTNSGQGLGNIFRIETAG